MKPLSSCCNAPVTKNDNGFQSVFNVCNSCDKVCSLAPDKVHTSQEGLRDSMVQDLEALFRAHVCISFDCDDTARQHAEQFVDAMLPGIKAYLHSHTEEIAKKVEGLRKVKPPLTDEESVDIRMLVSCFNEALDACLTIIREQTKG